MGFQKPGLVGSLRFGAFFKTLRFIPATLVIKLGACGLITSATMPFPKRLQVIKKLCGAKLGLI